MNKFQILKTVLSALFISLFVISCVQDDDYDVPPIVCDSDLTANISIEDLKAMYLGSELKITEDLVVEGYVVSSDEAGNIYKNLFIQNALENPTQGLTISLDVSNTYTTFPVGSKILIKLKDLYLGEYGNVIQLGGVSRNDEGVFEFGRMTREEATSKIVRACGDVQTVTPKEVAFSDFSDDLVGTLIKLNDVQVTNEFLCEPYALTNQTVNVILENCSGNEVLLRNSGYADFTANILPSGNGSITAILSKFGDDYQLYIRNVNDVAMDGTRCDGTDFSCTAPADNANVADLKALYNGGLTQITQDLNVEATIIANDVSGNLYKLLYVEDETGGIKVRINKTNLHLNPKYEVGKKVVISTQGLYVDNLNGEIQLGGLYNDGLGNIEADSVYQYVFSVEEDAVVVEPTMIAINDVSTDLIGSLVKFENVEFAEGELGNVFASGGATNRTFQDCSGNTMIIRTSSYANFAGQELPNGNGSLTGVLSIYNDTYQLWLRDANDVELTSDERCDGSTVLPPLFDDDFSNGFANWTVVDVTGAQAWEVVDFGNPAPSAKISGYNNGAQNNEDWLISNAITLPTGNSASFSFDNVKRYDGQDIEVYYTTDYTGDVTTTSWTQLSPTLDTDTGSWSSWTSSGALDVSSAMGGELFVAFKYVSTTSGAATFEIDNVKVSVQ